MAYLGVTPTTSSQSLVKQDFSVSATQNYTLSQSVTSANDIALYINNVRQEPTYAYSASGTSLTLTEATAGTDDMYCVYIGRAVGTINPASGSVGTAQITDSAITSSKLLSPLNKSWIKLGEILGIIIAPVVMALVYFIILTPISLIVRLFGKDLLGLKFLKNQETYWIKRKKNLGSMKKQF